MAWSHEAWDQYQATQATDAPLYAALSRALAHLAQHPSDSSLRTRRFNTPPLWAIPVRSRDQDWIVLWDLAEDQCPQVHYVGPDPAT